MKHRQIDYVLYIEFILKRSKMKISGDVSASELKEAFPDKFCTTDAAYAVLRRIRCAISGIANHSESKNIAIFRRIKWAAAENGLLIDDNMTFGKPGKSLYEKLGERKTSVGASKSVSFSNLPTFREGGCAAAKRDYLILCGLYHDVSMDIFHYRLDETFAIARATGQFQQKFGKGAFRLIIRFGDCEEKILNVMGMAGIEYHKNLGNVVNGYDFNDERSLDELLKMLTILNKLEI